MAETKTLRRLSVVLMAVGCFLSGCSITHTVKPSFSSLHVAGVDQLARPGHCVRLCVSGNPFGSQVRAEGFAQTVNLQPLGESQDMSEGFLVVPLEAPATAESITITAWANGQTLTSFCQTVQIAPREPFKRTHLHFKKFNLAQYDKESAIMTAVRAQSPGFHSLTSLRTFDWPVHGRLTETFGTQRIYNDGAGGWYHGGLDIAAPGGTTITAPADGLVIFTETFKAHGNTVLVDHGFGIIATYLHQRVIYVKPGDRLRRGDPIGEVGTTGGSTGNHLHFQINIHGRMSSPWDFLPPKVSSSGK